jgi:hypothetical protein
MTSAFLKLPANKVVELRRQLGDNDKETNIVCNIITQLAHHCETLTNHTPLPDFVLHVHDGSPTATLVITGMPCFSHSGIKAVLDLYPRDICYFRLVFTNEITLDNLGTGCAHIGFWRTTVGDAERHRVTFTPLRVHKNYKRRAEIDFTGLNTDADDESTLIDLIDDVHRMTRVMPHITVSVEPLLKKSATTASYAASAAAASRQPPRKRARQNASKYNQQDDDDTTRSENDNVVITNDNQHVGFALFCASVPEFEASFLDYLKQKYGNRILEIVVLAPVKWVDAKKRDAAPLITPQELVISIRRAKCSEEESCAYAIDGSHRMQRVMVRNAKAFKGQLCGAAGATPTNGVDDDGDATQQ